MLEYIDYILPYKIEKHKNYEHTKQMRRKEVNIFNYWLQINAFIEKPFK